MIKFEIIFKQQLHCLQHQTSQQYINIDLIMASNERTQYNFNYISQNKGTSKRLKHKPLQQVYYHSSSLPQKPSSLLQKSIVPIIKQQKQNPYQRLIQRKNKSLPKYIYSLNPKKQSIAQKSSVHNISCIEQTQQYRLQTLQQILKKKNSRNTIRQQFISSKTLNYRHNDMNKTKTKDIKHKLNYPDNRKYTNLKRDINSNPKIINFQQSFFKQKQNSSSIKPKDKSTLSRKYSSKKRIRTDVDHDNHSRKSFKQQHRQTQQSKNILLQQSKKILLQQSKKILVDIDLNQIIDPESSSQELRTLQDLYILAENRLNTYITNPLSLIQLKQILAILLKIQQITSSHSKKTTLLLAKVNFYLNNYHQTIYYLESVFQDIKYDLASFIFFTENQQRFNTTNQSNKVYQMYSQYFYLLAHAYKKTDNYLCAIKILYQWQKNVVQKYLLKQKHQQRQKHQLKQKQKLKQTKSSFNPLINSKTPLFNTIQPVKSYHSSYHEKTNQQHRKLSSHANQSYYQPQIANVYQTIQSDLSQRKPGHNRRVSQLCVKQISFINPIKSIKMSVDKDKFSLPKNKDDRFRQTFKKNSNYSKNHHNNNDNHSNNNNNHSNNFNNNHSNNQINKSTYQIQQNQQQTKIQLLNRFKGKIQFMQGYLLRARINYQMSDYRPAIKDYKYALACQQDNIQASLQLGTLYFKINQQSLSISFLQNLIKNYIKSSQSHDKIIQIKYHLGVILHKSNKYEQCLDLFCQIQKQQQSNQFLTQICFYKACSLMKILYSHTRTVQNNKSTKYSHTYAIQSKKSTKIYQMNSNVQKTQINDKQIQQIFMIIQNSIDFNTSKFYVLLAYYLKIYLLIFQTRNYYAAQYQVDRMKSWLRNSHSENRQFKKNQNLTISKKSSLQNTNKNSLSNNHNYTQKINLNQIKLQRISISGLQTILSLADLLLLTDSLICILKLKLSFGLSLLTSLQTKIISLNQSQLSSSTIYYYRVLKLIYQFKYYVFYMIRNYKQAIQYLDRIKKIDDNSFQQHTDQVNYGTLNMLVLMQEMKFHQAQSMLEQVQILVNSNSIISTSIQPLPSSQKYLLLLKSICYIQLYTYLSYSSHSQNPQILLSAQNLLSQCLLSSKQNSQILYLLSIIHYQLKRYDSALDYIRQCIQFSDDHMVKHYYLKGNMKLLKGKYQDAIKDFTNATTVWKQLLKQKNQLKLKHQNDQQYNYTANNNPYASIHDDEMQISNQYYQQQQEMRIQLYLNLCISYLKHSYHLQNDHTTKYIQMRESILSLKSAASQNLKFYFDQYYSKLTQLSNKKQTQQYGKVLKILQGKRKYLKLFMHTQEVQLFLEYSKKFLTLQIRLTTDHQLMNYFYTSKQLNNCLLMMDKIIKKHYLNGNDRKGKSSLAKTSSLQSQAPYLKTKASCIQSQVPYFKTKTRKNTKANIIESQNSHKSSQIQIQNLIFDKKVLSALKNSSSNLKQDYQNALVQLLEEAQHICKQDHGNKKLGSIFMLTDLIFFIGLIYYLLNEYETATKYFQQALTQKKIAHQLFTLQKIVCQSKNQQYQANNEQYNANNQQYQANNQQYKQKNEQQTINRDMSLIQVSCYNLQSLKTFQQIYDNRSLTKQQLQYNIGISYLMQHDYKNAYQYLHHYPQFLELIQQNLDEQVNQLKISTGKNQSNLSDTLKLKQYREQLKYQTIQHQQINNQNEQDFDDQNDITPFPTHNRLCSIYPKSTCNGKVFSLSFCLPKVQLPHLQLFQENQIQIAKLYNLNDQSPTSPLASNNQPVPHTSIPNILQTVSLLDIQMKPLAPWIRKDKEKKCIRFTDNFLSQSFDLRTQCTTQRKRIDKDMFRNKDNYTTQQQKDFNKNKAATRYQDFTQEFNLTTNNK